MQWFEVLLRGLGSLGPMALVLLAFTAVVIIARKAAATRYAEVIAIQVKLQVTLLLLSVAALITLILVSPLSGDQKNQLLSLLGIVLSATIALSSTTFLGNLMAGLMLRAVGAFRSGDFVRAGDYFGRVTEQGLFHIEIQTEDRDLTTLPNLFMVTNPVKVIRSSGTLITAEVSLGYDISRTRIQKLLIEAALEAGLSDPFVHVLRLGDFSVSYRVAGFLSEVKQLLSSRSRLHEFMLDRLHGSGIEIVSPHFMNTRALTVQDKVIPRAEESQAEKTPTGDQTAPESRIFDKAEEAEGIEKLEDHQRTLEASIAALKEKLKSEKSEKERERIEGEIKAVEEQQQGLLERIRIRKEQIESEDG